MDDRIIVRSTAVASVTTDGFDLRTPPPDFYDDPYRYYHQLRRSEPVKVFADGSVFLTRYDDVAAMYRNPSASSDKKQEFLPKFGDSPLYQHHTSSLVFNDAPVHPRVRKPLLGAVNQRAIARMEAGVQALVDHLLDAMQAKAEAGQLVDLIEDFAAAIPVEVIGNLLAFPREDRGPLRGWSLAILAALEPALTPRMHADGNRAVGEFLAYLRDLIADRRTHPLDPEEDVLTRLIRGGGGEELTEQQLLHNCIFLLNAGHKTTTNLIGNGVHALLTNRDQLARLAPECTLVAAGPSAQAPALLSSAIEEMLRYQSPLQLNNRRLVAPSQIGERTFAAGTLVTLCVGAANRDPAQFPEPDRFDIARKPNRHLAFGHGDHACAGMNVARMEARIALGRLIGRFPGIATGADPVRDRRVRFRGFSQLPVILST